MKLMGRSLELLAIESSQVSYRVNKTLSQEKMESDGGIYLMPASDICTYICMLTKMYTHICHTHTKTMLPLHLAHFWTQFVSPKNLPLKDNFELFSTETCCKKLLVCS